MGRLRHALAFRTGFAAAYGALILGLTLVDTARAQGVVKSEHGVWQIRCDTPPGAQTEQCALVQSVLAQDRANVGLSVLVIRTANHKLLRVLAPSGVLLSAGLGLKIDQTDIGRTGSYAACLTAASPR